MIALDRLIDQHWAAVEPVPEDGHPVEFHLAARRQSGVFRTFHPLLGKFLFWRVSSPDSDDPSGVGHTTGIEYRAEQFEFRS
jgi:hypothetical protein